MRILIASAIDPDSIERLSRDHAVTFAPGLSEDELLAKIPDKDVLVFRSGVSITRDVLRVARNLRLIVRAGSGLDNIDLDELRRRNIVMVRIPRPSAQAVAELTFTLMLGLARNLLIADSEWRQGHWVKNDLQNYLIHGKTLGVVGVGNIGQRVGEMGVAWGMRVIGCVHHWSRETSDRLGKLGIELRSFDEVVPEVAVWVVGCQEQQRRMPVQSQRQPKQRQPGLRLMPISSRLKFQMTVRSIQTRSI